MQENAKKNGKCVHKMGKTSKQIELHEIFCFRIEISIVAKRQNLFARLNDRTVATFRHSGFNRH